MTATEAPPKPPERWPPVYLTDEYTAELKHLRDDLLRIVDLRIANQRRLSGATDADLAMVKRRAMDLRREEEQIRADVRFCTRALRWLVREKGGDRPAELALAHMDRTLTRLAGRNRQREGTNG